MTNDGPRDSNRSRRLIVPFMWLGVLGAALGAVDSFLNKSLGKALFDTTIALLLAVAVVFVARSMNANKRG